LVSPHLENGAVKVYLVSDLLEAPTGTNLRVRLMEMDGKVLLDEMKPVSIAPLSSKIYLEWPLKKLTDAGATDTTRVFVVAEAGGGSLPIVRNLLYLAPTKSVRLKNAPLGLEIASVKPSRDEREHRIWAADSRKFESARNLYEIKVTSPVLARSIALSFDSLDVDLSDNYFDVLPGETVVIKAWSNASLEAVRAQMKAISLTDAFSGGASRASVLAAH
jgi:beta-mannosidase